MTTGTPRHVWADHSAGGTVVAAVKLNELEQDVADALATAQANTGGGYTDEQVRDVIGAALQPGSNVSIAVNDAADTITISAAVPNPVTSVAGRTGVVVLAKGDVGLGNVDNTSDVNKPVSTATALAISTVTANIQTASYTLVLGDAGRVVEMNVASANTLTIPPNSSVAFPIGTVIDVCQYGVGQTTLAPGAGVALRTVASLNLRAQYSTVTLRQRATNEWIITGDVA